MVLYFVTVSVNRWFDIFINIHVPGPSNIYKSNVINFSAIVLYWYQSQATAVAAIVYCV